MIFIDTHAHIYLEQFDVDLDNTVQRAIDSGVEKIFMPNIDSSTIEPLLNVQSRFSNHTYPMMGLHPTSVKDNFEKELVIINSWLNKGNFIGVGEIGTDLYWDDTFWEQQQEALKTQLTWAKDLKLPAILHSRETINDNIRIVGEVSSPDLRGIFHCFTGNVEQAFEIIELGFYLGFGGVSTFKNSGLSEVISKVPLDKIVLETDSPYLAPVPHRGKRNEPSYIPLIANKISEVKNVSVDQVAEVTTENALKIFSI